MPSPGGYHASRWSLDSQHMCELARLLHAMGKFNCWAKFNC